MSNLHAQTNVWETCLQLLKKRGYALRAEIGVDDDDPCLYWADGDGFTFSASNPIELLGLTAIYDDVKPAEDRAYWWCANTEPRARTEVSLDDELKEAARAEQQARQVELAALRVERPEAFRAEVEGWWAEYGGVRDTAASLGVRVSVLLPWLDELGIKHDRSTLAAQGS